MYLRHIASKPCSWQDTGDLLYLSAVVLDSWPHRVVLVIGVWCTQKPGYVCDSKFGTHGFSGQSLISFLKLGHSQKAMNPQPRSEYDFIFLKVDKKLEGIPLCLAEHLTSTCFRSTPHWENVFPALQNQTFYQKRNCVTVRSLRILIVQPLATAWSLISEYHPTSVASSNLWDCPILSQVLLQGISLHYILHNSRLIFIASMATCCYMLISIGFICLIAHLCSCNLYGLL